MFISLVLGEGFGSFLHETFPPVKKATNFLVLGVNLHKIEAFYEKVKNANRNE